MSDEPNLTNEPEVAAEASTTEDALGSLFEGMDESMFAAADAYVNESYLDTPQQQSAIAKMRDRALAMYHDYQTDIWYRAETSVKLSLGINASFAIYQFYMATRFDSIWFASLAIYSVMLTFTRGTIVRYLRPDAKDGREELERYRSCGTLLIMLTIAVAFLGIVVNFAGEHPVYPGSMLYVIGGYTLYSVYMSVHDLITYRKLESPLISASKSVAVACTLVSLYSLQAAALAYYCVGENLWIRERANLASAIIICAIILGFAVHIIVRASRALAGKEDLSFVVVEKQKEIHKDNRMEFEHYASEAQRQLEYWKGKDKVEWRTQGGAMERHDEEVRARIKARDERRRTRRKK